MYKFLCGHMLLFPLGIYLKVGLLGHMVSLRLPYCGIARLFSKPFHISTSNVGGSTFSTYLHTLIICLFDHSHPSEFEVASHLGFSLHFFDV